MISYDPVLQWAKGAAREEQNSDHHHVVPIKIPIHSSMIALQYGRKKMQAMKRGDIGRSARNLFIKCEVE